MSKLTRHAKNQECTIRLYPYCNGNIETTVFCHAPSNDKGMGIKSPDWWGADACSSCHDIVDGRTRPKGLEYSDILGAFFHGIFETHKRREDAGIITVNYK